MFGQPSVPVTLLYNNAVRVGTIPKLPSRYYIRRLRPEEELVLGRMYQERCGHFSTIKRALNEGSLEYIHGYRFVGDDFVFYRKNGSCEYEGHESSNDLVGIVEKHPHWIKRVYAFIKHALRTRTKYSWTQKTIDNPDDVDMIEVAGVYEGDGFCERVDEGPSDFYSVYVHRQGEGVECVADRPTKKAARSYAVELSKRFNVEILDFIPKD